MSAGRSVVTFSVRMYSSAHSKSYTEVIDLNAHKVGCAGCNPGLSQSDTTALLRSDLCSVFNDVFRCDLQRAPEDLHVV